MLPQALAQGLDLPEHDFWLFDDERLAILRFTPTGLDGAEIVTDPATVARYRHHRDRAWRHSVAFERYVSR
ncbi:hypothetical protein GCM10022243_14710 [Saccharothrix violaceirubra]|uniref:DUF6879 domain-containing protein n=1 Tax=Saccharothrix violaceirubra TaxID=413306 RepID=A0A7W7T6P6_9PSEU|nr:DUF6879 family protein [Saccharothrix violaceirubra]MBB4967346.1 hypothetical protein [Saccharothrix violaceirubra]